MFFSAMRRLAPFSITKRATSSFRITTRDVIDDLVKDSFKKVFGEQIPSGTVSASSKQSFGDYQSTAAMSTAKKLKLPPAQIAGRIAEALTQADMIATASVAGPGFVNIK
jgi:arginyl-tRNA synthetase